ncbi:PREDICTED: TLD domain-containing protein 1 isoform X1 [Populus euphratica]|uniref:TLD domain-containing protein 1 isoform X1 n=1 Tax=Populus euphratica TaxID=75702 RepID=A0AAJ6VFE9_POPEU|nr:PREDICTED: TLD domain-containing protein 1 isoform X1 [Populus euphratica]XP_011046899.1 PREDICTED: TLD domain-containing protein 1 isoform X1 [Populus euphratica]XP_011046900.1 PREDICTED: TLD domain-containing protein 1 isoform X1 [Populus euphratica]
MGNSQSPPADPRFSSATRAFTPKDLEDLNSLFVSLAAQSKSNNEYISLSVFQAYFGLKSSLGERLFDLVTQQRKDNKLTFHDLVIAKSVYEKGTRDDIEEFIYQLLNVTGDGVVGRCDIESVLAAILRSIFSLETSNPGLNSHREIINVFLNAAKFSKVVEGAPEKSMSFEDFRSWCALLPSVRKFLGSLLIPPDAGRLGSQVPQLVHGDNINPDLIVMREEYAWHIGGALPHHELEEWKLLYHSAINGMSFNTFLGSTSNGEGPTILIIKDKDGYIYGGYASQPWERHGDFYGDLKSFLFQLYPKASIFKPTGANNNVQWCAANFSSESIPNGIGFGGRVNHFGLFLSASFDVGQTFTCTTFGSPCLSKTNRIFPEVIECWGVVQNGAQEEKLDAAKATVLERFKEDRHMLNMVGLANSSE